MPAYADPAVIVPGLLLGSKLTAENRARLRECNVTHVVNASKEIDSYYKEAAGDDAPPLVYLELMLDDSMQEDIAQKFDEVDAFIAAALGGGGVVFVHCQAGVSRSATLVMAYLMRQRGMSLKEAYLHVKERKSNVQPNQHFFKTLQRIDRDASFSLTEYYRTVMLDMGFAAAPIDEALNVCDGDFDLALNRVLAGVYSAIEGECLARQAS